MAMTRTEWNKLQRNLPQEDRESYESYLATNPPASVSKKAPTSGVVQGFTPTVAMPAPKVQPGESGFIGPVVPSAPVQPVWVKAGTVQTLNGPVDVDANGVAEDGTTPVAKTPDFVLSGPVTTDKFAGLTALLASYGIDKIADMVDKILVDYPESDGEEILNLLRYDQRYNKPYMDRFAGNAARMKKNLPLLGEADYLQQERGYSKMFQSYGLTNLDNRDQYTRLISEDIDIDEATARVSLAYNRVLKAEPSTMNAFRRFFPMLSNQDLVSAMLNPEEQLPALERKVQSAEIGGAALRQGLIAELADTTTTSAMYSNVRSGTIGASTIETAGATPAAAVAKYEKIATDLPTMEKLSSFYGSTLDQYGQREAEQAEILGLASAKRKKEALIARERVEFQGSSGTARGSLARPTKGAI